MAQWAPLEDKLIVLIGGGGFFGTHLAQELLGRDARLRIADRHPNQAFNLKPLANLGQLQFAHCNVADRRSIEAVCRDADAVVYLVGTFSGDQQALQADGAGYAAEAAAAAGASAFAYVSAIGADAESESGYARTKGEGEQLVQAAFPQATIVRPSILFGEDDSFLNMFAGLIAALPVLPVFGSDARLQPVWVDDAAEAVANALADPGKHGGKTYELAGPDVVTMCQIHERIAKGQERSRHFIAMPDWAASAFASLPGTPMNADQWALLRAGNVASGKLPGLKELGVKPSPIGLFLDRWMTRYRRHGRFTEASESI